MHRARKERLRTSEVSKRGRSHRNSRRMASQAGWPRYQWLNQLPGCSGFALSSARWHETMSSIPSVGAQPKSPAASDGAGHAEDAGLPLSPMADRISPSTAASVFTPPGPFCWRGEFMGGSKRSQTAWNRHRQPHPRTKMLITLKKVNFILPSTAKYCTIHPPIRRFQTRTGFSNLIT